MNEDYLEACIRALPAEKREAARQAVKEISGDGDTSFITKLITVLDVTSAYAKTIPTDLKAVMDTGLGRMKEFHVQVETHRMEIEKQQEQKFRQIVREELPALTKGLGVTRTGEALEAVNTQLKNLEQQVLSMRHWRMGGLLALMGLSFVLGAGALYVKYADNYRALRDYYLQQRQR